MAHIPQNTHVASADSKKQHQKQSNKLLVPVTAAVATAKKHNQHRQILVVPTPGGGARLAAIARPLTLLRPGARHSDSKSFKSSSFTVNKGSCDILLRRNLRGSTRSMSVASNNDNRNGNNGQPDPDQLLRQQELQQKQLHENYLKMKREEESIPEWKRKEDYFAALGLVTKQALKEIQNKKCERKRRTTANPQFSNAAIEAKRITAMEVAAKRAKRRELAAAAEKSTVPINTRIPLLPQPSIRSSMRPSVNQSAITSSIVTSSVNHRQNLASNSVLSEKNRHPLIQRFKSKNQFTSSSSPSTFTTTNNNSISSTNRSFPSPSSTTSSNLSSSSKSTCVQNNIVIWSKLMLKCADCSEQCDPGLDVIVFCKDCKCYFHATCVSDVDEINASNSVPCPTCDKRVPVGGSHASSNDLDSPTEVPVRVQIDDADEGEDMLGDVDGEEEDEDDVPHSFKRHQNDEENFTNKLIAPKSATSNDSKNISLNAIKRKDTLITRNIELTRIISESETRRSQLSAALKGLKRDKAKLLEDTSKVQEDIQKVSKVIAMVKNFDIEKGQVTLPENAQDSHEFKPLQLLSNDDGKNGDVSDESDSSSQSDGVSNSSSESSDVSDEDEDERGEGEGECSTSDIKEIPNQPNFKSETNKETSVIKETSKDSEAPVKQESISVATENQTCDDSAKNEATIVDAVKEEEAWVVSDKTAIAPKGTEECDYFTIVEDGNDSINVGETVILDPVDQIPAEKNEHFEEDETSAAVASIQDEMEVEPL